MKNEKKLQRAFQKAARLQMKLEKYYDEKEITESVLEDYMHVDADDARKKELRQRHITTFINSLKLEF